MVFCNDNMKVDIIVYRQVTILILIDGFLQYMEPMNKEEEDISHNPYFNRWFSAIGLKTNIKIMMTCHNPYFNRWFSAIKVTGIDETTRKGHNPYFNRWFSAILVLNYLRDSCFWVTILILIDGFLQYIY